MAAPRRRAVDVLGHRAVEVAEQDDVGVPRDHLLDVDAHHAGCGHPAGTCCRVGAADQPDAEVVVGALGRDLQPFGEAVEVEDPGRRSGGRGVLGPHRSQRRGHHGANLPPPLLLAEHGGEERDPGVEVLLASVAQPDHGEPGVLQRREDTGALVGPLGDDVRPQGDQALDVGGEVGRRDVVRDVERLREELAEDAIAHGGPGGLVHPDEVLDAAVDRHQQRGGRHRHGDHPGSGPGKGHPGSPLVDEGHLARRPGARRRAGRAGARGAAAPERGEAEGAGAGQHGPAAHRGADRHGPVDGHVRAPATGGRESTARGCARWAGGARSALVCGLGRGSGPRPRPGCRERQGDRR